MNPKRHFTKKEEIRVLEKFITAMHGESCQVTLKVMKTILDIKNFDDLNDLKKKYKERMKAIEIPYDI